MLPKASGICAHCQRYTQMLPPRLNLRYGEFNYSSRTLLLFIKIELILAYHHSY